MVDGFYMLAEDISWRAQAEQRMDALLAAADAMLVIDDGGGAGQVNAGAIRLFGSTREALLEASLASLLTEPSRAPLQDAMRRLHDAPGAGTADWIAVHGHDHGGDRCFPIELRLSRLAGDTPLVVAAIRDTGEQAQLAMALQQEQAVAQRVLGAIGDAVVACDADRVITSFNPVAEELTGWRGIEAIGQSIEKVLRLVDHASGRPVPSPLEAALDSNGVAGLPPESVLLRRDGVRSPIEASAAPVHDTDGNLVGAVMVFHDVSESRAIAMKMSHLAQHDYLTDLPNRVLLQTASAQALAAAGAPEAGAVLFVDLDFFKNINDFARPPGRRQGAARNRPAAASRRCASTTRSAARAATSSCCCCAQAERAMPRASSDRMILRRSSSRSMSTARRCTSPPASASRCSRRTARPARR